MEKIPREPDVMQTSLSQSFESQDVLPELDLDDHLHILRE